MNFLKLMIFLMLITIPYSFAEDVILVSENCADSCTAATVASTYEDVVLITTVWGDYDGEVLDNILSYDPETVTIIGGPVAVVDEYKTALESEGIEVERIYGLDRYSTNEKVLDRFRDRLRDRDICILYGEENALNLCNLNNSAVILSNGTGISVKYGFLENFNTNNINLVTTPIFNGQTVTNQLRNQGYSISTRSMSEQELEQNVLRIRNNLQIRIENMENNGINVSNLQENLLEINSLIENGEYQYAYAAETNVDGQVLLYQHQYRNRINSTGISYQIQKQNQMQTTTQNNNQIGSSNQNSASGGSGYGK